MDTLHFRSKYTRMKKIEKIPRLDVAKIFFQPALILKKEKAYATVNCVNHRRDYR